METEFDTARAEFYKTCPQLIVGLGPWINIYFCSNCKGEINPNGRYMFAVSDGVSGKDGKSVWDHKLSDREMSCPHCFVHYIEDHCSLGVYKAKPIKSYMLRRREVYTTKRPNWWARLWGAKQEFFHEYHKDEIKI